MRTSSALWRVALLSSTLCISVADPAFAQAPSDEGEADSGSEPKKAESESALDKKRSSARQLATDASGDYRMGRFQDAYDNFNRAFHLVGVPALGVWSARSLRQMNQLVEASERYREVLKKGVAADAPASHQAALADARAELDELMPRIPNLKITLENAEAEDVEVQMDGEVVDSALVGAKQRVNPGTRKIVAKRGDEVVTKDIQLAEGASEQITLPFKPGYKAPPKSEAGGATVIQQGFTPLETTGIVLMAGGGALLATGVVTTILALGQQETLRDECVAGACPPEFHSDVNKFNTMKVVSTGTLIGGAVLGGVGAALYFGGGSKGDKEKDEGVALYVRGSTLGLKGSF
jgi:hypothetical protein